MSLVKYWFIFHCNEPPFGCFVRDKEDLNRLTGPKYFFAHSVRIKLALPQAALLSFPFSLKVENQWCCTSTRDLIKDTPLIERMQREEREKSQAPSGSGIRTWDLSIRSPMRYHLNYHLGQLAEKMFSSIQKINSRCIDSDMGMNPHWNYQLGIKNLYNTEAFTVQHRQ